MLTFLSHIILVVIVVVVIVILGKNSA